MGKVYIEKMPFSLMELVRELKDFFQPKALEKNLALEFDIDENLPDILIGDSFRLRQILMNLFNVVNNSFASWSQYKVDAINILLSKRLIINRDGI